MVCCRPREAVGTVGRDSRREGREISRAITPAIAPRDIGGIAARGVGPAVEESHASCGVIVHTSASSLGVGLFVA